MITPQQAKEASIFDELVEEIDITLASHFSQSSSHLILHKDNYAHGHGLEVHSQTWDRIVNGYEEAGWIVDDYGETIMFNMLT
jgi:hypothetical protein